MTEPIWTPDPKRAVRSAVARFAAGVGMDPLDYPALWRWSVEQPAGYWQAVWDFLGIESETPYSEVLADARMPGARWFPGASVNYARQVLRRTGDRPALIGLREDGTETVLSWDRLRGQVGALAQTLRESGVAPGDRVVGYLPPGPHAAVALLAAATVGAVWAQCAQDYSADAAIDRFGQLAPVVLVAADGYAYNGRIHDRRGETAALEAGLPSLRRTITVAHQGLGDFPREPASGGERLSWEEATRRPAEPRFEAVPFDHPLWVLFTSGTTGRPKGIVHGHGGTVLGVGAFLALQFDLGQDDTLFWYSSTNWMMWNIVVSALLTGATTLAYDGSPVFPHAGRLFEMADRYDVTHLGTSPAYLQAAERAGLRPAEEHQLSALRTLGSTGSPLPKAAYHWTRDVLGPGVQLASVTGGTDVMVGFAGSAPTTPVWPGELSAPCLGVRLESWDENGRPHLDRLGELVVTAPLPSMPLCFWGDPDGLRYQDAYFGTYPGVWRHGDWITMTERGTVITHGRSDSTLNRRGVRLGSAEIYQALDRVPDVIDSLVVGVEEPEGGYWMPLFVVPAPGVADSAHLRARIEEAIRTHASPRHVPDEIVVTDALPRTRTGKRIEVPVKRILQGADPDTVLSAAAVDRPETIAQFVALARRRPAATDRAWAAGRPGQGPVA